MYPAKMQNLMNELQLIMGKFNNTLVQVQQGLISLDGAKSPIEYQYQDVKQIYNEINSTVPPARFNQIHKTLKEATNLYVEGINEFKTIF